MWIVVWSPRARGGRARVARGSLRMPGAPDTLTRTVGRWPPRPAPGGGATARPHITYRTVIVHAPYGRGVERRRMKTDESYSSEFTRIECVSVKVESVVSAA